MRGVNIYFENKPFRARVSDEGDEPMVCTPVACDIPNGRCGVAICFSGSEMKFSDPSKIGDLIAAWRATEVLRSLLEAHPDALISRRVLNAAYRTGTRNPFLLNVDRSVRPMIAAIGLEAYLRIMAIPVPAPIIRATIDSQSDRYPLDAYPITHEAAAGTIKSWLPDFYAVGILNPDSERAKNILMEGMTDAFESLLCCYQEWLGHERHPDGHPAMDCVKKTLLWILQNPAANINPRHVLVGLAGALARFSQLSFEVDATDPDGLQKCDEEIARARQAEIDCSAYWIASIRRLKDPTLKALRLEKFNRKEAREILGYLFNDFPLPDDQDIADSQGEIG